MKLGTKIRNKLNAYWRVLRVTKKPDAVEFKTIIKVSGMGIALIGIIGFIIQLAWEIMTN